MATIDLSRHITNPAKHYAGVRMKQGQVLTDDDFNEAARIAEAETRRTRLDVIGPTGTPDAGFLPGPGPKPDDMSITAGTLYLGGLRLTVDPPGETYRTQRDWLRQTKADLIVPPTGTRTDLAWVEAWEQPVTATEDAELLERALGGPDTSGRSRVMRRIHIATDVGTQDCVAAWSALKAAWAAEGSLTPEMEFATDARLRVAFGPPGDSGDLCSPTIQGGYLGALNQAIRVQLTDSSHFVWGFDNAAPLYRVQAQTDKNGKRRILKMITRPRDQAHWPLAGQIIELLPWSAVLPNRVKADGSLDHRAGADGSVVYNEKLAEASGFLALLDGSYNPTDATLTLRLADEIPADYGQEWTSRPDAAEIGDPAHPWLFMRVWNHGAVSASDKTTAFQAGKETPLGATGLSVTITGAQLRAGDYWIIAARPATPDQVTPWQLDAAAGRPPHGPRRYRAPLGLLAWGPSGGKLVHDCRKSFLPLTLIRGCCTIMVGDGHTSFGQVNAIQTALDMLPDEGGEICLLPGKHRANARIRGLAGVTIHGCGEHTWVIAEDPKRPVFEIEDGGRRIVIEKLALQTGEDASGILAAEDARAAELTFSELIILAGPRPGIEAHEVAGLTIRSCRVVMRNVSGPWPAIFSSAQDALIERNLVEVDKSGAKSLVAASPLAGRGGLQLGGGSNRVRVRDNQIRGGVGNGITLGSLRQVNADGKPKGEVFVWVIDADDPCSPCKPGGVIIPVSEGDDPVRYRSAGDLYDITIDGNRIEGQGLSGIGVVGFFNPAEAKDLIVVHGLTVRENRIASCLNRPLAPIPAAMLGLMGYGAVTLGGALDLRIAGNTILNNGLDHLDPVCGIFVLIAVAAVIEGNTIENTGAKTQEPSSAARPGARSGVHVGFAMPDLTAPATHAAKPVAKFGLLRSGAAPALTVTDNIVGQPLGRSLTVLALGQVAARGNRLVSQGVNGADFLSALAGNVLILTLGFTHELPLLWLALILHKGFGAMAGNFSSGGGPSSQLCAAIMKNPGKDVIQLGAAIPSAKTLFTDNQCVLDLMPEPPAVLFSGCLLISTDDVVFTDNQAEISESQQYTMINTVAAGMTVRAAGNRFAEGWLVNKKLDLFGERLSALTVGVMNATTDNQGTHCFRVAAAYPNLTVNRGNRSLIDAFCPNYCAGKETPLHD